MHACPVLYVVIPCYNEESVLPVTYPMFMNTLSDMITKGKVSDKSRLLYVNDGSDDLTWEIIKEFSLKNEYVAGISQSKNRGHQSTLLAGLMEAKKFCDISISIDCDGQDDIWAMEQMVDEYLNGCDIVYGVRSDRNSDKFFKRETAQMFYKTMKFLGAETVYNHADYRLLSKRVLDELEKFPEVNLFLRGLIPLIGFKCTCVCYERHERKAGKTHYSLGSMTKLAIDGITSFTIKPIRFITLLGVLSSFLSFALIIWIFVGYFQGNTVIGWASTCAIVCFMGGIQLISIGVIGEYIGKIYLETKHRPRFIISEKTGDFSVSEK